MAKTGGPKEIPADLKQELQTAANSRAATIISFVAPYGVRTSPISFASASINESEIYKLEKIVDEATKKKATENLDLVIHTPGGDMHTAYKIATVLRSKFKMVRAFVPYEAASGGTVLCCAANEIYIGDFGNLTAFDPQVRYKDTRVAAYAFERAAEYIREEYGEMQPAEIPPPWQQMAQKLDPIIYDEMHTAIFTATICSYRLLKKSGYDSSKAVDIALALTKNAYTHGMPIFSDDAKKTGFIVKDDQKDLMRIYQKLVSDRLQQSHSAHVINAVYPVIQTSPKSGKKRK